MPADTNDLHQSVIDYSVVRGLRAAYDLDEMQLGASAKELQRKARLRPRKIGFSIGSGFHANAWPVAKWVDLARELLEKCDEITILCGLPDLPIAKAIAAALGNPRKLGLEIGSSDFASFVSRVAELDVVIATDGGTAHLCSLGAPILSICGPSPYRRYSPFGLHNRLITRDMSCSPCCQYAAHLANSCLSNECMIGISPDAVAAVALRPARTLKAGIVSVRGGFTLVQGTSHLDREEIFDAFEV
jgi:heptosyltransferase-2